MFKLVTSNIGAFKSSFGAIGNIVNEAQLEIDEDGLRLNAIDSSHVTFIHMELREDSFDVFESTKPEKISFDCDEFLKVIKRANKDSIMELSVEGNNLVVKFEGATDKTFKIRLMDIENDIPDVPTIDFPTKIGIQTSLVKEIVSDIDNFSQKLQLHVDGDVAKFTAFGDYCDAEIEWVHGQKNINEEYDSVYDLSKIKEMLKADKFARECYLSYGNDMPLLLEMVNYDESEKLGFMLAPRIEEQ
ncbi:MAG: DNA polymerase sliding clamp [Methanosphaera sp. rholeuAM270]|nr:MAG: DNA polymerase sliding clamp [Methanosphaera sp. rholeuAM270]